MLSHQTTNRDVDLCKVVLKETENFKKFVEHVNYHFMPESDELPRIVGLLANRCESAESMLVKPSRDELTLRHFRVSILLLIGSPQTFWGIRGHGDYFNQASPLMREFSASWQFFKTNVI